MEIDRRIKKELKEVEGDPNYSEEQKQLYRDRHLDIKIEQQSSLEILSQNQKDLQTQVVTIKQATE